MTGYARLVSASAFVLTATACGGSFDDQMALLEKYGIAQRDCIGSEWFSQQRPDLFEPGNSGESLRLSGEEANSECTATRRLVEELREPYGLFRRYRCKVFGQDVEVSYSSARNDRDAGLFSWCEYAYGGDKPLDDSRRYTFFRDR